MELLLDQYELKSLYSSKECVFYEVNHWKKNEYGGANITPIGRIVVIDNRASESFLSHHSVDFYYRSEVKYNEQTEETIVVSNPERQAGTKKSLLKYLIGVKNSNLPSFHPELPDKMIQYLIKLEVCKEPIAMTIYTCESFGFKQFGKLWDDEDSLDEQ